MYLEKSGMHRNFVVKNSAKTDEGETYQISIDKARMHIEISINWL